MGHVAHKLGSPPGAPPTRPAAVAACGRLCAVFCLDDVARSHTAPWHRHRAHGSFATSCMECLVAPIHRAHHDTPCARDTAHSPHRCACTASSMAHMVSPMSRAAAGRARGPRHVHVALSLYGMAHVEGEMPACAAAMDTSGGRRDAPSPSAPLACVDASAAAPSGLACDASLCRPAAPSLLVRLACVLCEPASLAVMRGARGRSTECVPTARGLALVDVQARCVSRSGRPGVPCP